MTDRFSPLNNMKQKYTTSVVYGYNYELNEIQLLVSYFGFQTFSKA